TAAEIAHDLRHPVQADTGDDNSVRILPDGRHRIGRYDDRQVGGDGEQEVAEYEIAHLARLLQIFPLAEIQPDQIGAGCTLHVTVAVDDQQAGDPGQVDRQA